MILKRANLRLRAGTQKPKAPSIATKKDKGTAAPEANACANCLAPEGQDGSALLKCNRCGTAFYCDKDCQIAHWKAGHKQQCVTPKERVPQPQAVAAGAPATKLEKSDTRAEECPICWTRLPRAQHARFRARIASTRPALRNCGHSA